MRVPPFRSEAPRMISLSPRRIVASLVSCALIASAPVAAADDSAATSPEPTSMFGLLGKHGQLAIGQTRHDASRALKASFRFTGRDHLREAASGPELAEEAFSGAVLGYPGCELRAFFTSGRLLRVEVVIPSPSGTGSAKLMENVAHTCLKSLGDQALLAGFDTRRGREFDASLGGREWPTSPFLSAMLRSRRDKIDHGLLKAEGYLLMPSGDILRLQTPSIGWMSKHPQFRQGCLVLSFSRVNFPTLVSAWAKVASGKQDDAWMLEPTSETSDDDYVPDGLRALERKAKGRDAKAEEALAAVYVAGRAIPADRGEAIAWCRRALEDGDEAAAFKLATLYENHWYSFLPPFHATPSPGDLANAAAMYERAGRAGNAKAWVRLGELYRDGRGVKLDPVQARLLLTRAADAGDEEADFDLATLESATAGYDAPAALRYLEAAARHGHVLAASRVADHYMRPSSGPPRWADAVPWLKLATYGPQCYDENVSLGACVSLSALFEGVEGVPRNAIEALKWLLIADARSPGYDRASLGRLKSLLGPREVGEAERLAKDWLRQHPTTENTIFPFEEPNLD